MINPIVASVPRIAASLFQNPAEAFRHTCQWVFGEQALAKVLKSPPRARPSLDLQPKKAMTGIFVQAHPWPLVQEQVSDEE